MAKIKEPYFYSYFTVFLTFLSFMLSITPFWPWQINLFRWILKKLNLKQSKQSFILFSKCNLVQSRLSNNNQNRSTDQLMGLYGHAIQYSLNQGFLLHFTLLFACYSTYISVDHNIWLIWYISQVNLCQGVDTKVVNQ